MNHKTYASLTLIMMLLLAMVPISAASQPPLSAGLAPEAGQEATAPTSSTTDPTGDGNGLWWLEPSPDWLRDLTVVGNTMTIKLPTWIIHDPASFYWYGATQQPSTNNSLLDAAPDATRVAWTAGGYSSTADAADGSLQPYEDITNLSVGHAGNKIQFQWQLRGDIPANMPDVEYRFDFGDSPTEDFGEWELFAYTEPFGSGWGWDIQEGKGGAFDWHSTTYEDIVSASITDLGNGQLKFEMTTASAIPATPAAGEGDPSFGWMLDTDNNSSTGPYGDKGVYVRYNSATSGWEGVVCHWNGSQFVDGMSASFTRTGSTVSATVKISDLGLASTLRWYARSDVMVGPAWEQFHSWEDKAPDPPGMVTMRLGQAPVRVFLPIVLKNQSQGWVTVLAEGFEGAFPGAWQLAGGEYYWGKRNCLARNGSFSAWAVGGGGQGTGLPCGSNYPNSVESWMIYGPFSLKGATSAWLSYQLWINSQVPGSEHVDYIFDSASLDGSHFHGFRTSGDSHGWMERRLDLSDVPTLGDLTGQPAVWIAIAFVSDGSVNFPVGAYVDNLAIQKYVSATSQAPLLAPDGEQDLLDAGAGRLVEVEWHMVR